MVEYTPKPCFKPFGDAVSDARRAGDVDPSKAIIADAMELVGNRCMSFKIRLSKCLE